VAPKASKTRRVGAAPCCPSARIGGCSARNDARSCDARAHEVPALSGRTETHALLPGSVAVDRIPEAMCMDADGLPLTTDERSEPRPGGAMCDVSAFEVQP